MKIKLFIYRFKIFFFTLLIALISFVVHPILANAEIQDFSEIDRRYELQKVSSISEQFAPLITQNRGNKTPGRRCFFFIFCRNPKSDKRIARPARLDEAGRRGQCSNLKSLKALIPKIELPTEQSSKINLPDNLNYSIGFTSSEYPTLWFYIPQQLPQKIDMAEFMVQNEEGKDILNSPIPIQLSNQSGIVSFQLDSGQLLQQNSKQYQSSSVQSLLKSGQAYHWYFSIICDARRPSRNPSVDGWIKLEDVSAISKLQTQLETATAPAKRIEIYADNDLWYDTVTNLVKSRCANPNDPQVAQYWSNFLREIGLNNEDAGTYCDPKQKLHIADKISTKN